MTTKEMSQNLKIVNMAGGLGNQMFQYAFATMLQQHFPNDKVMVDTQHYNTLFFKEFGSVNLHNGYEINLVFSNATLPVATKDDLRKVTRYIPNYVLARVVRHFLPRLATEYVEPLSENFTRNDAVLQQGDCYYEGYWQSHSYYTGMKPLLHQLFTPPRPNAYNSEMTALIEQSDSIGLHVRRGDYKSAPEFNGICTPAYYKKAIEKATNDGRKHTLFVFSNDIPWCREHPGDVQGARHRLCGWQQRLGQLLGHVSHDALPPTGDSQQHFQLVGSLSQPACRAHLRTCHMALAQMRHRHPRPGMGKGGVSQAPCL